MYLLDDEPSRRWKNEARKMIGEGKSRKITQRDQKNDDEEMVEETLNNNLSKREYVAGDMRYLDSLNGVTLLKLMTDKPRFVCCNFVMKLNNIALAY